jgi:hypothetical protein
MIKSTNLSLKKEEKREKKDPVINISDPMKMW